MDATQLPTGIDGNETLAGWLEVVNATQIPVQTHLIGDSPFSGKLTVERFGAVSLSQFRSTPVRYVRGPKEISIDPGRAFEASLTLSGKTVIVQDGKEVTQRSGDIVLFDTSRPFEYVLPEGDDQIVMAIPHALLREHLPNVDSLTCTVLSGQSTFGRLVGNMIREVKLTGPNTGGAVAARVGFAFVDLLATAFDVELGTSLSVTFPQSGSLEKVKAFMLDHLSESELDVQTIARENNVSARSLHRLFAAQETTAMRWLWNQRLHASYKALSVGRVDRVSDVAIMYGFTNFSHFARSFKQAFGVLPQSLLRSRQ
jgi:AraC family transcriptional regulator, positive regulator of tynA and feaB